MKKVFIAFMVAVCVITCFVSCATARGEEIEFTSSSKVTVYGKDGIKRPNWVTKDFSNSVTVYGVGYARYKDENEARKISQVEAKNNLAEKIFNVVNEVTTTYMSELGKTYDIVSKQTALAYLSDYKVADEWVAKDGTVYTLISIPVENVADQYYMNLDLNQANLAELKERMNDALTTNNL